MIKKLLALTGGVGCAMALQGCAVGADGSEESLSTLDTSISSTITVTSTSGNVYCSEVKVANNLSVVGNNWRVVLDMKGSSIQYVNGVKKVTNANADGNTGRVTFTPTSTNGTINPGATTAFSFCATAPNSSARAAMAGYNMTSTQYAVCDTSSGVNPTRAALAVAMATELGRWKPEADLMVGWDGMVALTSGGLARCTNGCSNTKGILAMQNQAFQDIIGQQIFSSTNFREDLKSSFNRQQTKIDDLTRNNPGALPPAHKLTLVGGPTNMGNGSCGPHYVYKATDLNNVPLTSAQAANLANALCFYGQGSCGNNNPYIGFINNAQGCPSGQTCVAIDPSDTVNSTTNTTSAGTAPTYGMNKAWDPTNVLLNTACITTGAKLGEMKSKCTTQPTTCGWLYCTAL